jgi:hypothetical protein
MNKKQLFFIFSLVSGMFLAAMAAMSAVRAGNALLSLSPPSAAINPGETISMTILLESSTAASGVDVHLAYDPAILLVLDADPLTDTIQISPGSCPEPDFIVRNEANVVSGTIQYAVVELGPDAGCLAGDIAVIEFQCVGPGTSEVIFSPETELSDPDGIAIVFTTQNASVTCGNEVITPTPTLTPTLTPTATLPSPKVHLPIIRNDVAPTPTPPPTSP